MAKKKDEKAPEEATVASGAPDAPSEAPLAEEAPAAFVAEELDDAFVRVSDLEERYLAPLLERIERLEHHARVGPPARIEEQRLIVRTRGRRKRHVCSAGTFTKDWRKVLVVSASQAAALRDEELLGTIEVRPDLDQG